MNSSSEIARFRKLDCCSSCDTLLVGCTPRMTELAAGRVYIIILLHYAHACNTTLSACTTHLRLHHGNHAYTQ